ncbi:MAG TPA: hypothetical protein VMZ69_04315 [Saprospiraceae bacterium]|nr:hypothetical protein [Saprospiraceae bacterium]
MNAVNVIGKYLFGFSFLIFGVLYLINANTLAAVMPVTGSIAWVYVSGLVMLFAGIAVLIGKKDAIATFLLGLLFLVFVAVIHLPLAVTSSFSDPVASAHLLRDLALSGAAFVYCRSAAKDRTVRLT